MTWTYVWANREGTLVEIVFNNIADGDVLKYDAGSGKFINAQPVAGISLPILEGDVVGLATDLAGKAAVSHTHAQTEITNLVDTLATKASASHKHTRSDVTDFAHIHAIKDITGLQKLLDSKQNTPTKAKPAVFNPLLMNYRVVKQ